MNPDLHTINKTLLDSYYSAREGETRLGQTIFTPAGNNLEKELKSFDARFVLVGIPEDMGVRANHGKGGTAGFWPAFISTFLSIQSNTFLKGEEIILAGNIACDDLMEKSVNASPETLSKLVTALDNRVSNVLEIIFSAEKIPVIIGGGHNNAYPIIKAANKVLGKKLGVLNIDPHADLRSTERRHSGNGFSFALNENLMDFYLQAGLHESYNNQHILDLYKNNPGKLHYFSYEDFLDGKWDINGLKQFAKEVFRDKPMGLEFDCDSIENMPSSAATPSGFSPEQARQLVRTLSATLNPVYFHLPEAIAADGANSAKLVSYLVADFMKSSMI